METLDYSFQQSACNVFNRLSGASTIGNARHSPASLASVRSGSVLVLLDKRKMPRYKDTHIQW